MHVPMNAAPSCSSTGRERVRASAQRFYVTFVPAALVLAAIAVVSITLQVPMGSITGDVAAIAHIHPLSGFLSSLGILLWCTTASICLFAALLLRNAVASGTFWFLISSASLSTYLLLDDLFQVHESLAPNYLGLSELTIYGCLGLAICTYLVVFRRFLLSTDYAFFLAALGLLGASVAVDVVFEPWLGRLGDWEYFLEDGSKWLGTVAWCSYYCQVAFLLIVDNVGWRRRGVGASQQEMAFSDEAIDALPPTELRKPEPQPAAHGAPPRG